VDSSVRPSSSIASSMVSSEASAWANAAPPESWGARALIGSRTLGGREVLRCWVASAW
jgi:hypothetical protein